MSNTQDIKHYDVIVIGSGAGAKISTPSSKLGLKVALCEKDRLGGTCLNKGCIPSKMLIHPADVASIIGESALFEIDAKINNVRWKQLVQRVSKTIDDESFSINPNIENNPNIDWYREPAKFVGDKLLQIGENGPRITGDKIFIVAGGRPSIPNIDGLKDAPYMTSTEALRCEEQPKELIVLGGGYIACELAHFYAALGTKVHMFVRSKFLRHEDYEIREEFTRIFSKHHNINVHLRVTPTSIHYDSQKNVFFTKYKDAESGQEVELVTDNCLIATGIRPNSDQLDLSKTGVKLKEGGYIQVDEYLRTNVPNVWAFGDIAGNYLFRHSANFEGEYLLETVIREKESDGPYPIDYTGMPHAVFSYPQVAGVGETEDQLKARGADYVKGVNKYEWSAMGMALRSEITGGIVKLLIERKTRRILGCHIVGEQASVLIHEIIPLVRLRARLDDILYTVHIHPALSELIRNAARRARNALLESGEQIPLKLSLK